MTASAEKRQAVGPAAARIAAWRAAGESVALARGGFDLIDVSHLGYLKFARGLGERLVVALIETDSSAIGFVLSAEERAILLSGLALVDLVVPFRPEDWPRVVATLDPDVVALSERDSGEAREAREARRVVKMPADSRGESPTLEARVRARYRD